VGSRKAAFGLGLRPGLTAPNRIWDSNPLLPGRVCSESRNTSGFEPADAQDRSRKIKTAAGMIQIVSGPIRLLVEIDRNAVSR
jgi:hypothetical protein